MTMWVWRLTPIVAYYDDPVQMQHDEQFFKNSQHPNPQQYANCDFTPTRHGQCREWAINSIFDQQKLRQGWCGVGLDLNLPRAIWLRNYQLIDPNNGALAGIETRYQILTRILDIRAGDTIFLPKVGNNRLSENHFTVVTVAGNYYFENRAGEAMYWKQDFGHIIPLSGNLTRTFPYNPQTLDTGVFSSPFIACVVRVPNSAYRRFDQFLRNQKYRFNPY